MNLVRLDRRAILVGAACVVARRAWAGASTVLVLAERAPRHDVIVAAFRSACAGLDQIVYPLDEATDAAAFLADGIRDLPIDVVLAVGDRALRAAAREFTTVPVVYVDVTDASAGVSAGAVGVSTRVTPGAGLDRLVAALPRVRRFGSVRSARDTDDAWWTALAASAEGRGVGVEVRTVGAPTEVPNAVAALLARAEALWILPDRQLWTGTVVASTLTDATTARVPVVGPDRSWLTAARPAALVLETSARGLGVAAAAAVLSRLGQATTGDAYAEPWLVGDAAAWRGLGLLLTKEISARVDEWVVAP